jgi:tetratricopeptide (TPR) repeat protein
VAGSPRLDELERRIQQDPASIAFAQLAEEHRRVGNFDEAVRVARTGLAQHPSYLSARVTLGRALMELEQYDDARTELEHVLRLAPDNLAAIRALAEIHQRRGELGDAARQFTSALDFSRSELVLPVTTQLALDAPPPIPDDFDFDLKLQPAVSDSDRSLEALDRMDLDIEAAVRDVEDPALTELEAWLAAILDDRARRS